MLIKDSEYKQWLGELKRRIRQSQIKAAIKVNSELLRLYWDLGRDIVVRQMEAAWGSGFFEQLSKELRSEFPNMSGFSESNLKYCKRFYLFYNQNNIILQQVVAKLEATNRHQLGSDLQQADNKQNIIRHQVGDELEDHPIFQIPWRHHVEIFTKCKSIHEALFYVQKTIKNGWSRAVLMNFMEADLYSAQGKALNNFSKLLPEPQSDLANEIGIIPEDWKVRRFPEYGIILQGLTIFKLFSSSIVQDQIRNNSNATINQITKNDFNNIIIPFPLHPEQSPIATALSDYIENNLARWDRDCFNEKNATANINTKIGK
ncbi:MAG: DUF1016 N-terminal domain-containing protein [Tannerella sp.]|nr:DUF1016 N-terminal domain-containing protein [Tannerella sp.]